MKKKILSLVLVVAMLASMLVLAPVSGATEKATTLAFGNAVGVQGDTVTVDFTVTTKALAGIQFMFEYDASRLTYDGIEWTTAKEHGGAGFPADLTDGDPKVLTATGPYKVLSWATGTGVGALDLSEGATLATLTFSVKEDAPLGDAYVRFVPLAAGDVKPNKITGGVEELVAEDMTFVDGSVTVLPEGYSTESTVVVHEITQEEADSGLIDWEYTEDQLGIIITAYTPKHAGAVLVLPSEIDDSNTKMVAWGPLPVVGIKAKAFQMRTEAAVVIPESVTEISSAAFFNCTIADYYVMNSDCVINPGAMGTYGNYKTDNTWALGPFVRSINGSAPTIHGAEGSTAAEYASTTFAAHVQGSGFNVNNNGLTSLGYSSDTNLPAENTLTFNGTKYYFTSGTEVTLPGMMEDANGNLVVAWNAGAVGSTITITEDIVLESAKTIAKPQTSTEVGLKLADPLSMRFKATFGVDDYATLASLGTVELGMLITPARYVSHAGAFTKEALAEFKVGDKTYSLGEDAYVDVALNGYFSKTEKEYTFAARLENFSDTTLAKNPDFAAVMYATVTTADGATFTVYGDFNFAANTSVLEVAENTSTEGQTDPIKNAVAALIKKLKGEEA